MKQIALCRIVFGVLASCLLLPTAAQEAESAAGTSDGSGSSSSLTRPAWHQTMLALRRQAAQQGPADRAARAADAELAALGIPRADAMAQLQWLWEHYPETDWFLQDQHAPHGWVGHVDARRDFAWYLEPRRDARREAELVRTVLRELAGDPQRWESRLAELEQAGVSPDDPRWLQLYVEVCQRRRQQRLRSLVARVPCILLAKHYTLGGSHYAYTEGLSDAQAERHFVPGAELTRLVWDGRQYRAETLLRDQQGVLRDPDVSWDGQRILFSWKKSDRDDDYHLYEMELDTRAVRQLTFGLGVADYEGVYLPGGEIIFNSTRCIQTVDCWWTEVSNLYRCDADGRSWRRLTFDQVHDNFPTVTPDGRVLYTRWEYNDRGQIYPQPLLQMNADGTNQREFYGGSSFFPTTILHARAIPGGNRVVAIATGHHSRQTGKLIELDPSPGCQEDIGAQLIAPLRDTPAERIDAYGQSGELFQYPYPVSDAEYLVAYHPAGWPWAHGPWGPLFGVYWMDRDGRRELLLNDPAMPCGQPIPLVPRPEPREYPSQVDYRQPSATCYIQDVYAGSGCDAVPRGTVRRLRVVTLDFRAAGIGSNRNRGPGGSALISTPVAIGNGTWDSKRIVGETEVHADGSAYFRVPARLPVYFQLLDDQGQLVQTMRSWTTLQPGENASCVGCHEHKNSVPLAHQVLSEALRAGPADLEPLHTLHGGFSFPRYVQPILDRHCVRCHNGEQQVPYDLTDTPVADPWAKRRWSRAYLELTHARRDEQREPHDWRGDADHPLVNWVSAQSAPSVLAPFSAGSTRSRLLPLLAAQHAGAVLSPAELDTIAAWIDLGVPFCGDYEEAHDWNDQERDFYRRFLTKRRQYEDEERRSTNSRVGQSGGSHE